MEKREELLHIIVHQLRAPLVGLHWSIEGLLKGTFGPLTKEQEEILAENKENTERLMKDVESILTMDESRYYFNSPYPTNIAKVILNVVNELKEKAEKKKITLETKGLEQEFPRIMADKPKIYIAIENLIENAIKYTPENGKVSVEIRRDDDHVTVSVEDNGMGISEKDRQDLFTIFFRAENAKEAYPHGVGIGLYVTKKIIEAHGGSISCRPGKEGLGSLFTFTLPLIYERK